MTTGSPASDALRAAIAKAVGKALYGWGDDEPNTATGFLVRHDVKAVTDAVLEALRAAPAAEPQGWDRLAQVLHEMGGEFCAPFTTPEQEPGWPGGHPVAMHNSQAAAILERLSQQPEADHVHNFVNPANEVVMDNGYRVCTICGLLQQPEATR